MAALARKATGVLAELGLTVLAIAGAVCIALVIAAEVFGVSIILFSTGSMSPTIPAGSAALVREIPASEVAVGDVVTVDRPGALPVTHRVVAVDGTGSTRELTLRGDANPVNDPSPYEVGHVRLVIASVPGLAPAIAAAGEPAVLGTVTVLVAGVVTWAFWPRTARGGGEQRPGRSGEPRPEAGASRSWVARPGGGAAVLALAVASMSLAGVAPPAQAADVDEQVVHGEVLRLTSILDTGRAADLRAEESVTWEVGVESSAVDPGAVTIDLEFGAAGPQLAIAAASCEVRWTGAACPAGVRDLGSFAVTTEAGRLRLDAMPSHQQRWLRLTVRLAETQDGGVTTTAAQRALVVRATGAGETLPIGSMVDGIPETGVPSDVGALAMGGVLLLAVGGALLLTRRAPVDQDRG